LGKLKNNETETFFFHFLLTVGLANAQVEEKSWMN
jgi:hypothetical protein